MKAKKRTEKPTPKPITASFERTTLGEAAPVLEGDGVAEVGDPVPVPPLPVAVAVGEDEVLAEGFESKVPLDAWQVTPP